MIVDARNREINLGSHVRYVDTGTVGEVTDSKVEMMLPGLKSIKLIYGILQIN